MDFYFQNFLKRSNSGFILRILDMIEFTLKFLGKTKCFYFHWGVLIGQAFLSCVGIVACAVGVQRYPLKGPFIPAIIIFGVALILLCVVFTLGFYRHIKHAYKVWVQRYYHLHFICKIIGTIAVFKGFVHLSIIVEKHEKLNGWVIGFFLCCFLCLITLVKLYGREDAFGTGDSLTVIAIMKFILLPNERIHIKNVWIIFYGIVFLLMVFKGSEIPLRGNVCGKPAEDDDIEAQNPSQPTLIESGSHGQSWRLPLNVSHVFGQSDEIELNNSTT